MRQVMADSLNLVGDGDDIDVIRDVERAFGIQIADHEAEAIRTVGQLYDLIQARCPGADRTQACLSQVAFYRLRRALAPTDKTAITPRTPIAIVHTVGGGSTAKAWTELARRPGLTLPRLETPFTFAATPSLRTTLGSVAIGAACFAAWAVVLRLPPLIFLLGLPLLGIAAGLFVHAAFRGYPAPHPDGRRSGARGCGL
jgi:hypothetical protein